MTNREELAGSNQSLQVARSIPAFGQPEDEVVKRDQFG